MPMTAGTRIGSYEIAALVGSGGMGEVYRARDTRLGRDVALKVLPASVADDPERLRRFTTEAQAVGALNHPNVLTIYEIGEHDGQPFLSTELLEGQTLRERLNAGALPFSKAIDCARQAATGLAAAHARNIAHRDIKPENLFITTDGRVKILDFGLARNVGRTEVGRTEVQSALQPTALAGTEPGMVLGTVGYMSPEQVRGLPVDHRSDLFSLGVVLFEMLAGRRPFIGDSSVQTMNAILTEDPPEVSASGRTVPPAVGQIVRHCLEKNPDERFQSARDLAFALNAASGSSSAAVAAVGAVQTGAAARASVRARTPVLVVAGLAAAVALGWWVGSRGAPVVTEQWNRFTQLTDQEGEETAPSISPDGGSFAYASRARGTWDIYTQRVGGRNPAVVAGDPARDEAAPAFSPDGTLIAFHESDDDGGIFVVGATGESARRVTETGFHPAWSPDGRRIVFCFEEIVNPYARSLQSELFVVDVGGGASRKVADADAVQPAWSPSGARIAYWGVSGGRRDIYTVSADGGPSRAVTADVALDWGVAWSPDGKSITFASDRGGSMNLWRVAIDEASGEPLSDPEPLTLGVQASAEQPAFAHDGSRVVFRSTLKAVNPVAIPFDPDRERLGEPRFLFRRTAILLPSDVSADGEWLAYFNIGERQEDVFISRADGSGLTRLTDDAARDRRPQWSPDGRELAFYSNRSGRYQAWSIGRDGGGLRQLTEGDRELFYPIYDPTTGRIAVRTNQVGQPIQVFDPAKPWGGQEVETVTSAAQPAKTQYNPHHWSSDGRRLVGALYGPAGIASGATVLDLRTGTMKTVGRERTTALVWVDNARVISLTRDGGLVLHDIDAGRTQVLAVTGGLRVHSDAMAISPDRRTLYVGALEQESDIWMVERSGR